MNLFKHMLDTVLNQGLHPTSVYHAGLQQMILQSPSEGMAHVPE